jgi:hypothetical protein
VTSGTIRPEKAFEKISPRLRRRAVQLHVETLNRRFIMQTRRAFASLAFAATAAIAFSSTTFSSSAFATGSVVDVQLVDRSQSEALPVYSHRGASWVAGRPGARYAVRLCNRTGDRVLVVLSVDGVNAVSGETAAVGQTGYVLAPYQTTEITGWRKSMTEAAAFYFTALPDSYAARTDRPDNVGVIGVAVFREKERELSRRYLDKSEPRLAQNADRSDSAGSPERERAAGSAAPAQPSAVPAPASPPSTVADSTAAAGSKSARETAQGAASESAPRDERLGTGHGEREYSPTTNVAFERASERPNEIVRLRYDSYRNLVATGVIPTRRAPQLPDPFPSFVPDAKG